ncbi:type II pantothenate kinase [Rossellomorea aquimaris]|uniref:type II pantothenate kinase n=1 Tax=Rossellomorea aquimaris TaxID=189382 RepID=UPI0007D09B6E|nr:type II pantothenate kinase [Rossellomorea aquimaris]
MKNIGIDAGGTLTKIVYEEKGRLHYKSFLSENHSQIAQWLHFLAPHAKLFVTGGKAGEWKGRVFPEFEAVCHGASFLLQEEKQEIERFILINIGTGTSFFKVEKGEFKRLLGSGIGGGTFMGLGSLIAEESNFHELVNLTTKGDREKVDLLVKDIYEHSDPPVPGYLTAANFAKVNSTPSDKSDQLRALSNLIAETIILLSSQMANAHQMTHLVFVGSTLEAHSPLKEDLSQFKDLLSYTPVFLDKGAYTGSLGAYLLGTKNGDTI